MTEKRKVYASRKSADAAARRKMRSIHGQSYIPKSGIDFTVTRDRYSLGWVFEIINEAAHIAACS